LKGHLSIASKDREVRKAKLMAVSQLRLIEPIGGIATTGSSVLAVGLVQFFFLVGGDGAVRGGVSHTGEYKPSRDLVIIQEGLVRLVNGARFNFASTGGTSTRAAGVGQIDALLFSSIQNVLIFRAFNGGIQALGCVD
jgi:hypothetical protein